MNKKPPFVMESYGRIEDSDRSFDVEYWQRQGDDAIFSAAWELVITYYQSEGLDVSKLRLQRSIEEFGRLPS